MNENLNEKRKTEKSLKILYINTKKQNIRIKINCEQI